MNAVVLLTEKNLQLGQSRMLRSKTIQRQQQHNLLLTY